MCIEDINIGRATISAVRVVTLSNATRTSIAAPNPKRIGIEIFRVKGAVDPLYAPDPGNPATGSGVAITADHPRESWDIVTHGSVVRGQWWGSGDGGAASVIVIETILQD